MNRKKSKNKLEKEFWIISTPGMQSSCKQKSNDLVLYKNIEA